MRVRLRDQPRESPEPRTVRAADTALFRGALMEISKKDAEIARLRALLTKHGIDPEAGS